MPLVVVPHYGNGHPSVRRTLKNHERRVPNRVGDHDSSPHRN